MILSVSKTFEKLRSQLNQIPLTSLTSQNSLNLSHQLDKFIYHYQKRKLPRLDIVTKISHSNLTLELFGQLDIITAEELNAFINLNTHRWKDIEEVYIDLSELNFFDTSGIQAIIFFLFEIKARNISLIAIKTSSTAYEVLKSMNISTFLREYFGKSIIVK